jgi:NAD(P)-dependent dehydrogenase (short-subunit alcohol dehydrogenase family)
MTSKVIIVTGASRGIGLAICEHLLQTPSTKLVILSRGRAVLEDIQSKAGGGRVEVLAGDLADLTLGQKAVDLAISKFGRVDGIILNHGAVEPVAKIVNADMEEWRSAFDLNVFSCVAAVCSTHVIDLSNVQGCHADVII